MNPTEPTPLTGTSAACVDAQTLGRFLSEHLDEADEVRVEAHLEGCEICQRALEAQAAEPATWSELAGSVPEVLPKLLDESGDSDVDQVAEVKALLDPTDDPAYLGRIGAYEVSGMVGSGATGVVLKAMEPRLNRFVAIKLMSPRYRHHGAARSRFEREGQAVAAVSNEHVVPIFAVDDHRGLPFIVMQYVGGPSLQERMDRDGPLGTKEVTRIGLQVAKGLAAAHAQGIVHRDVKPANVLLQANVDRALVTDFGLARVADEAALTMSGTIAGTPQFMSPEQARGDTVDASSDLFSLGSLMYAASTGRPPFRAENVYGVIRRVCESNPRPIRDLQPGIEPWLAAFVEKLMGKDAADRFGSAAEVADRLGEELAYLQSPTVLPEPPRAWWGSQGTQGEVPRKKRALVWCAAGLLAALGGWGLNGTDRGRALRASVFSGVAGAFGAGANQEGVAGDPAADLADAEELGEGWSRVAEEGEVAEPLYALDERRWVDASGADRLVVALERGDVAVVAGEAGAVRLRLVRRVRAGNGEGAALAVAGHSCQLIEEEGTVRLTDSVEGAAVGATYELHVPRGMRVDVATEAGHVSLGDGLGRAEVVAGGSLVIGLLTGEVDARTNGGGIQVASGFAQDADLFAVGGDVHVAGATGDVYVRTSGGDVYFGMSTGSLSAQTSGGDVHVDGIGGITAAHASVGSVFVRVPVTPTALSLFSATGGDVSVAIDEAASATLHVRGDIESEIEFETEYPGDGRVPYSAAQVGEGSAEPIQVTTSAGKVAIEVRSLAPDGGEVVATTGGGSGGGVASGEASGASGAAGGGLGGSALGGSGLGGSGLGGSGLSGSGSGRGGALPPVSDEARARMVGSADGPATPGAITTVRFDEPIDNIDGYTLYLPRTFAEREGRFPVLVYLQGAFGVGGEIDDLHHWGLARLVRDETDMTLARNRMLLDEFIVVCPHSTGGQYHRTPRATAAILDALERDYRADPDRVSVTGLSIGGHGCWGLAAGLPDRFAAIAPMGSETFAVENLADLGSVAIWISHNVTDSVVQIESVQRAAEGLEGLHGVPFRRLTHAEVAGSDVLEHRYVFTSSESGGHDAWTDVYTSEAFYSWLLGQRRSAAPTAAEDR